MSCAHDQARDNRKTLTHLLDAIVMRGYNMKARVLTIVRNALAGAEDNLYRASMQFGKMTEKELNSEYGQSGRTCGQIYEEYQTEVAELKRCATWVESAS